MERHCGNVPIEIMVRVRKRSLQGASHYLVCANRQAAKDFASDLALWIKSKAAVYVEQERKGCVRHKDAFLGPLND